MRPQTPEALPSAVHHMQRFHADVVKTVSDAIARERIVVVGMAQNPFVKKTRELLKASGYDFSYIEYGSYLSQWKQRLAIKLWSGWPTFPQIYVQGKLLGGHVDLKKSIESGDFAKLLQS